MAGAPRAERRGRASTAVVAVAGAVAFVVLAALLPWQLAVLVTLALLAAWAMAAYVLQARLNAISHRGDTWGELARQVGSGFIAGQEWQLRNLPQTMAAFIWLPVVLVIAAVAILWLAWGALGAWLVVPTALLGSVVVARARKRIPEQVEPRTKAEAASDRINEAPGRFLWSLQHGLAKDLPTEEGMLYVAHQDVAVRAAAAGERCVLVEIDVHSLVRQGDYPGLAEAIVSCPFLKAHTYELLEPDGPHQFRAMIDLEPLPRGESGPHVLTEVPRLAPGHLALGIKAGGRELDVELAAKPNGLYLGPTRGGKSISLNVIAAQALLATREDGSFDFDPVIAASTKNRADFAPLGGAAEVYGSSDQAKFTNRVLALVAHGRELAARLEAEGIAKLDDISLADRPPKVCVILDECRDWLIPPAGGKKGGKQREDSAEYELGNALAWLYTKAGFLGWTTILAHQGGKQDTFGHRGGEIVNNAGFRLCFGHLTTWMRSLLLEGTESDDEGGAAFGIQGRGNIWQDGGSTLTEFQGYYITHQDIRHSLLRAGRIG